jgi:hypothetical protein
MPPIVKVYEAIGALADRRVKDSGGRTVEVVASDGKTSYVVEIDEDGRVISASDNASYWQGYIGYPGIAVMIGRGLYQPSHATLEALRGIPWREINRQFRNDWTKVINQVEQQAAERGFDPATIRADCEAALAALLRLAPLRGRRLKPARANLH